jgi:carboxymethylenebutenolidase
MDRMTASDFDQELLDLYDGYAHGTVSRRQFFDMATKYTVGGVTGAALLELMSPNYALAAQVDAMDPKIKGERIEYPSPKGHGAINAYMVKPADATGKVPGVVVVHENRGLNPYVEDVARRLAIAGFVALAPDGLTPAGGYPGNDDDGAVMQKKLDGGKLREDFFAAFEFLRDHSATTSKVGVVGFCYGGGIANAMAVRYPDLAAAAPYYGSQPQAEDVPKIQAPLLLHYAGLDKRIGAGWPAYEAALKANNKTYTAHVYPDVNHGFHNDTTPRYDDASAKLSWERTIAFFNKHLKG